MSIKHPHMATAHFVRPKKHLGQHFLKDASVAQRVAGSLTGHGGYKLVVEVGPGTGALSKFLIGHPEFRWVGVDVDRDAIAFLRTSHPGLMDQILEADFLRLDVTRHFGEESFAVVGNFPYNISSQILFKVLELRYRVPEMVGMFQKEVAQRIATGPGSKTYGILSVLTQAFFDVELLFQVSEHVFDPPPKVKSAVIRLQRKAEFHLDCDEKLFFTVVKTAFNQRRKTLRNALRPMNVNWDLLPVDMPGLRAERLGVDEFVNITRSLKPAGDNLGPV